MTKRYKLPKLTILAALTVVFVSGCATQPKPLYHWGDYQSVIYAHFTGEQGPEAQIQALEKIQEQARADGKALPPGFRAHLAMLYGQTGRQDRLAENLESEKKEFPESLTFVDFLLKKIKRQ